MVPLRPHSRLEGTTASLFKSAHLPPWVRYTSIEAGNRYLHSTRSTVLYSRHSHAELNLALDRPGSFWIFLRSRYRRAQTL